MCMNIDRGVHISCSNYNKNIGVSYGLGLRKTIAFEIEFVLGHFKSLAVFWLCLWRFSYHLDWCGTTRLSLNYQPLCKWHVKVV